MKIKYKQFPDKQLEEKLEELKFRLLRASNKNFAAKKERPENYSRFRREIARIKTEISRRKNDIL